MTIHDAIKLKKAQRAEVNEALHHTREKRKKRDLSKKFLLLHKQIEILKRLYFVREEI